ncbi:hypothetical protein, partial [Nitrosomonas sp. Nm166]|uniref:hypothetical protein n=1 Tax=Nitrosomonas sp. Nm166 TaxID=1881054 RepID=UPI001C42EF0F
FCEKLTKSTSLLTKKSELNTLQVKLCFCKGLERTHQGKICNGKTPMETLLSGKEIWKSKNLN